MGDPLVVLHDPVVFLVHQAHLLGEKFLGSLGGGRLGGGSILEPIELKAKSTDGRQLRVTQFGGRV